MSETHMPDTKPWEVKCRCRPASLSLLVGILAMIVILKAFRRVPGHISTVFAGLYLRCKGSVYHLHTTACSSRNNLTLGKLTIFATLLKLLETLFPERNVSMQTHLQDIYFLIYICYFIVQ